MVSALLTWRWGSAVVPEMGNYRHLPIELDLTRAVTMTATMASEITPRRDAGNRSHVAALWWKIEDTIDGDDWYEVVIGAVTAAYGTQVKRISAPLGVSARLGVRGVVTAGPSGTSDRWSVCDGETNCNVDHTELHITRTRFNVAVRTI